MNISHVFTFCPHRYECEKCKIDFSSLEDWKEHQSQHLLQSMGHPPPFSMLPGLPGLPGQSGFPPMPPGGLPFLGLPSSSLGSYPGLPEKRRAASEISFEDDEFDRCDDPNGQKRMRTTILPEQLDFLYQQYQLDCNPSRKQLEFIAERTGLKKRVVQVWFQNTRARERKGHFRAHQQQINKRCPFCRALFKAKSALESHLATKHPEEMARGQVNIDELPDEVGGDSGPGTPQPSSTLSPQVDMVGLLSNPFGAANPFLATSNDPMQESIKQMYEASMKRYMDTLPPLPGSAGESYRPGAEVLRAGGQGSRPIGEDAPLDLSKHHATPVKREQEDDMSETLSNDGNISMTDSNPPSPTATVTMSSPGTSLAQHPLPPKRFRTQLSALQVKMMKDMYLYYKTPTMSECELMGREIGLAKRVIQVWFQNARAKEKKTRAQGSPGCADIEPALPPPEVCELCNYTYSTQHAVQDHLFSRTHIINLKAKYQQGEGEVDGPPPPPAWDKGRSIKTPSLPPIPSKSVHTDL